MRAPVLLIIFNRADTTAWCWMPSHRGSPPDSLCSVTVRVPTDETTRENVRQHVRSSGDWWIGIVS